MKTSFSVCTVALLATALITLSSCVLPSSPYDGAYSGRGYQDYEHRGYSNYGGGYHDDSCQDFSRYDGDHHHGSGYDY